MMGDSGKTVFVVQHTRSSGFLSANTMNTLTRQALISQLRDAEQQGLDAQQLAAWAFDHFYAEEAGTVEFETGYRHAIGAALDDLMFGDQPGFTITPVELHRMIHDLEHAEPAADDEEEQDDDPEIEQG